MVAITEVQYFVYLFVFDVETSVEIVVNVSFEKIWRRRPTEINSGRHAMSRHGAQPKRLS